MKILWKLQRIFIIAVVFTILSACSWPGQKAPENNSAILDKDKLKLRFISSWGGVDSKADTLQEILNRFTEDNPGIEVVNESMFGEDFLPKIKTDFASGNDQDVFGLWPGSDIRALVKANKVADITEVLDDDPTWKNSFKESNWFYTTYNGGIYGVPLEIIYEGLFINRDLFEKYGVQIPKTYEDLKKAVVAFKKQKIIPIAYNTTAEGTFLYQNIIAMLGGKSGVEKPFHKGKVSRCYIDAFKYMKELYQIGAFPEDAYTLTSRERNRLFTNKKAAMIVQGSWFIGDLKGQEDSVDIIPFPSVKQGQPQSGTVVYGLGNGTFHISQKTWNDRTRRDPAIRLLKALTSVESATLIARQTGMVSNVKIPEGKVKYGRLNAQGQQMIDSAGELVGPPDSFVDRSIWEEVIVKKFLYVLEGREDSEEMWIEAMNRSRAF